MKKIILPILFSLIIICCSTAYKNITAQLPDLANMNDGVYRGVYDLSGTPVDVTLDVIIQDNKIIDVKIIKHVCSPIGKKAEVITEQVIKKQSLDIDVISGATGSSKAILKAVEIALKQK